MLDDQTVASELAAIAERLKALAAGGEPPLALGTELGAIRAQLRMLAAENAEVAARLGASLGLAPAPPKQFPRSG